jgi:hypothetical protein
VFRSGSPSEYLFADKTLANALTDRNKHFADLVGADGALATLSLFVSSHFALDPNL